MNIADFPHSLLLAFLPLFVAMDAVGNLPFLLSLTDTMETRERMKTAHIAVLTAMGLGLFFFAVGKLILNVLSVEIADFLVAGGIILLALALKDLVTGKMADVPLKYEMVAVVPIGTPLLVGPAVLTTLLLLMDQYSLEYSTMYTVIVILVAFLLNLLVAWIVFIQANRISRLVGESGLKAVSKVASLLLAAIAVKMIRLGILEMVTSSG